MYGTDYTLYIQLMYCNASYLHHTIWIIVLHPLSNCLVSWDADAAYVLVSVSEAHAKAIILLRSSIDHVFTDMQM